jgi:hypothetical protein
MQVPAVAQVSPPGPPEQQKAGGMHEPAALHTIMVMLLPLLLPPLLPLPPLSLRPPLLEPPLLELDPELPPPSLPASFGPPHPAKTRTPSETEQRNTSAFMISPSTPA